MDNNLSGKLSVLNNISGDLSTPEHISAKLAYKGEKGDPGVGISEIYLTNDYCLQVILDNGEVYISPSLRGPQGIKGETGETGPQGIQGIPGEKGVKGDSGLGIKSIFLNDNYTLTITFDDNTFYTTSSIRGQQGQKGETGNTGKGIISIQKISTNGLIDTYEIAFSDNTTTTFDVVNGADGTDGSNGIDGHSPVITSFKNESTTSIYSDGVLIASIEDGIAGSNGKTPVITASKTGDITTIFADGVAIASIKDGVSNYLDLINLPLINNVVLSGNKAANDLGLAALSDIPDVSNFYTKPSGGIPDADIASAGTWNAKGTYSKPSGGIPDTDIASATTWNNKYTKPSGGIPSSDLASGVIPSIPVTDVQIAGTSILNNKIANIIMADISDIKNGAAANKPITPSNQNALVFYALAKAAGDTTQSLSNNPIGTYTDEAKTAIRTMLGIVNPTVSQNSTTGTLRIQ